MPIVSSHVLFTIPFGRSEQQMAVWTISGNPGPVRISARVDFSGRVASRTRPRLFSRQFSLRATLTNTLAHTTPHSRPLDPLVSQELLEYAPVYVFSGLSLVCNSSNPSTVHWLSANESDHQLRAYRYVSWTGPSDERRIAHCY
jgi:hypothetical protein